MCKQFEIAKNMVVTFILEKKDFSLEELTTAILDKGGLLQISPMLSLKKYLESFEYNGNLKYIPIRKRYKVLTNQLQL